MLDVVLIKEALPLSWIFWWCEGWSWTDRYIHVPNYLKVRVMWNNTVLADNYENYDLIPMIGQSNW